MYKGGPNLRNRLTHGLLSFEQFGTAPVVYFWWVMLKLCLMASPRFQAWFPKQASPPNGDGA